MQMPELPIAFGCAEFGAKTQGDINLSLAERFWEAGGRCFDTAHVYAAWHEVGDGSSERELNRVLGHLGILDEAFIVTKGCQPSFMDYKRDPWFSLDVALSDLKDSTERLGRAPDVWLFHRDDGQTDVGPWLDEMKGPKEFGGSNWKPDRLLAQPRLKVAQSHYTLAEPHWEETEDPSVRRHRPEALSRYRERGVLAMGYSAAAQGFFEGRDNMYATPNNLERRRKAQVLAQKYGVTPTQVNYAWMIEQGVLPVFGASKIEQMDEAIAAARLEIPGGELYELTS